MNYTQPKDTTTVAKRYSCEVINASIKTLMGNGLFSDFALAENERTIHSTNNYKTVEVTPTFFEHFAVGYGMQ
jgi:tRNA U38,U39,U40 pseudouridine synthase TruA